MFNFRKNQQDISTKGKNIDEGQIQTEENNELLDLSNKIVQLRILVNEFEKKLNELSDYNEKLELEESFSNYFYVEYNKIEAEISAKRKFIFSKLNNFNTKMTELSFKENEYDKKLLSDMGKILSGNRNTAPESVNYSAENFEKDIEIIGKEKENIKRERKNAEKEFVNDADELDKIVSMDQELINIFLEYDRISSSVSVLNSFDEPPKTR